MRFDEFNPDNSMILYHGSSKKFTTFNTPEVYLTDDELEAEHFATGFHQLKQTSTNYVYEVAAKIKNMFEGSDVVDEIIMEENEKYETIEDLIDDLRKQGYDFLYFKHPSATNDELINVYVSLYPNSDLKILNIF